jgi:dTDP-4-dehydrorhamnose 3,5-epimerase
MTIQIAQTNIHDVLIVEPQCYEDARGFFYESFNQRDFDGVVSQSIKFVQDNHAKSSYGVLRGLHYQMNQVQAKLVRVVAGAVYDVVVDMRLSSPTYGKWFGIELSAENKKQLWIPEGMAHGYLTISDSAEFCYKTTDYWDSASECCLLWSDPTLNIDWPIVSISPIVSDKDKCGLLLHDAEKFL